MGGAGGGEGAVGAGGEGVGEAAGCLPVGAAFVCGCGIAHTLREASVSGEVGVEMRVGGDVAVWWGDAMIEGADGGCVVVDGLWLLVFWGGCMLV